MKKIQSKPDFSEELLFQANGFLSVAGIDEAGRGPLAGPVVAGAVSIPRSFHADWLYRVRDSKQLSANAREKIFLEIKESGVPWAIGIVNHDDIDRIGILNATKKAMLIAVRCMPLSPDFLLTDAVKLHESDLPFKSIIKGDQISVSIAAASIIAKITRDCLMIEEDARYPHYGFATHKGYPTKLHKERLRLFGPSPIHRRSFSPVKSLLQNDKSLAIH